MTKFTSSGIDSLKESRPAEVSITSPAENSPGLKEFFGAGTLIRAFHSIAPLSAARRTSSAEQKRFPVPFAPFLIDVM